MCGCGCAKTIEFRYCVSLSLSPSTFSVFQKVLQCKKKQKDPRTNTNEFEECKQKRIYISIRVCHTSKRIKLITHIENAASAIYEWLWFKVVHFDMLSEKNSFHFVVFFPSPDLFLPWVFVDVVKSPRNKKNLSWRHHHLPNNEFHVCANMKCK